MSQKVPSLYEFASQAMEREPIEFAEAPWMHDKSVLSPETWKPLVDPAGHVPGGIPAHAF